MTRSLFDPDRMPDRPAPPAARSAAAVLSVTQLGDLIKQMIGDRMPGTLRVSGEISNFSDRQHWYFSIKDAQAVMGCVMWASAVKKTTFKPAQGQQVVVEGRLDYYGPQGRIQLYIEKIEPVGAGSLEQQLRKLMEELRSEGFFEIARKKSLPVFPRHIAVITSATGAAFHDVVRTARQRWAGIRLTLIDVRVQGAAAAAEVARAIHACDRRAQVEGIDAILVTRGGGSLEDLWAFNDRQVAEAIFAAKIPVVAAIGHETDTTLAELVADLRCSTPTQAAARLVPDARVEGHRVAQLAQRLERSLLRSMQEASARLKGVARHPIFRRPEELLEPYRRDLISVTEKIAYLADRRIELAGQQVDRLVGQLERLEPASRLAWAGQKLDASGKRLAQAIDRSVRDVRLKWQMLAQRLEDVGPGNVLKRGFTYTTDVEGHLLTHAGQAVRAGVMRTQFVDGVVESRVSGVSGVSGEKKADAKLPDSAKK